MIVTMWQTACNRYDCYNEQTIYNRYDCYNVANRLQQV
jgi:hypothetical protein